MPAPWWHRPALRTKSIKHWRRSELVASNLDFHFVRAYPMQEQIRIWLWELDRELGSATRAFVTHSRPPEPSESPFPDGRINYPVPLPPGVNYHPLNELLSRIKPDTDWIWNRRAPYSTIHAFEIQWCLGIPAIEAAFHAWVLGQETHRKRGKKDHIEVFVPTKGRKDFIDTWLMELAIYRIDSAGLKYKDGPKHLEELGVKRQMSIRLDS
jgi:hypothetical protein